MGIEVNLTVYRDTTLGSKALMWKIHMPAALTYNLCDDK